MQLESILKSLELDVSPFKGDDLYVVSPIDGKVIASLAFQTAEDISYAIDKANRAFESWRSVPAPRRGELVRLLGDELRRIKEPLAQLVTIENGKILEEGRGEVQEMIDICDFAVGLSRTIGGYTLPSERLNHTMEENWHPLGVVGVISAFNFPVAVWSWNAALALVCGDAVLWKPSEKTPLTALACEAAFKRVVQQFGKDAPEGLLEVIIGDASLGQVLVNDTRVPLISATGSSYMGGIVAPQVAKRFGKCLLELGGNNAVIVTPSADMDVALPSIVFGAVGTAGQRCTTTRRAFIHRSIYQKTVDILHGAYQGIHNKIGDPLQSATLIGPLIDKASYQTMQDALDAVRKVGGVVQGGERVLEDAYPDAYYVKPAIVTIENQAQIVMQETFAPILYVMPYDELPQVMVEHNAVAQGLSSSIFTTDIREAEYFKQQSDCGIANVNIGTSGAEIGGAFGGEKETGGGRESGSDAWKIYMRRQTSTTYYGKEAPALAQGISFG